jgi:cyclophilin family peptidyl-prolyl cis-trans isomerase
MRKLLALGLLALLAAGCTGTPPPAPGNGTSGGGGNSGGSSTPLAADVHVVLNTSLGNIRLVLYAKTPITTQNFVNLTKQGYFDGQRFHRVIKGFMDQGGDPLTKDTSQQARWGTGGPGYTIQDEFWCSDGSVDHTLNNPTYQGYPLHDGPPHQACDGKLGLKHDSAGVLAMANTGQPDTGGSQFFLDAAAQPSLDGAHPVFGHTEDQASVDVVLAINSVQTDRNDRPVQDVMLNKATVVG